MRWPWVDLLLGCVFAWCFVAMAGCASPGVSVDPIDVESGVAQMAYSVEAVKQNSPSPEPSPGPDGDRCENCNGTGKIGDGRVMVTCPVCDGTGRRTREQLGSQSSAATVEMATQANCPPCERWWENERPKWERQGWRVTKTGVAETGFAVTPSFTLRNGSQVIAEHEGWMSTADGRRLVGETQRQPIAISQPATQSDCTTGNCSSVSPLPRRGLFRWRLK